MAIIRRALRDLAQGRPCGPYCRIRGHVCKDDALAFLRSDGCKALLEGLDLSPAALEKLLGPGLIKGRKRGEGNAEESG